ncbi:MAG: methylmalonyl-CoA mutase [Deltaproteobacteria bacterium CG12_big_fil_rev_8_21_14_0_65_43_10]|nr:MAG: methylmalonyl-CoA mutase [Deltaproteobacteria bacterium CG12_big_fil_rev_8_21_14_0_65_43_10]PIU85352.1 MAG: methylmalonyl-CoA mutase [Deltaproteobacteria bacterium CG06_land_8_20_14_3_00_44_19]PIX25541.1 MAG: methylmalonyl-CoA mutase [Deltaproteobacteria bacterium CG_4_8_14_3_um_filter_43_13]PIZ18670.1 MAG: methylmalonyl-CoA mutase [Deltaproteobacteria bacterium CG_4_10_14_0_8_um_filter_43_12]PJB39843.1 MAG: methylmalonyl-CoA mutase [Deltaproteobacteria bacterium CG_4_9_14_3_um_filter_4
MFSRKTLDRVNEMMKDWEKEVEEVYVKKLKFGSPQYTSESGIPLNYVYSPEDVKDIEPEIPGAFPYTRGNRALGYQYMPWMIQLLHGYGTGEETRERTKYLIREGMKGYGETPAVLFAVDTPTHCGFDPDSPKARGMVGLGGVNISTLDDIHTLLKDYDLPNTRVADNIRFTCLPFLAMYVVYAEGRGHRPEELNGQSQNGLGNRCLTTNLPAPTPDAQYRLEIELIKYSCQNIKRWNHTNLCGYVFGEMNITPTQELGIVLSKAVDLVEGGIKAGLKPDEFVPRFSSQVHLGMDFFEEIAKLRAWRRMWAKIMKERFGCNDPRSLQYRIHVHTAGSSLTSQQPLNNIARATLQVLACVLGGVQSMHTNSYDEAIGLPSEEAVRTAIRINQIVLHETGIPHVTDPMGGSYYLEFLTNKVEEEAEKVRAEIESKGGYFECIKNGWLRQLLEKQSIKWRQEVDSGERIVVGLNKFKIEEKEEVPAFTIYQPEIEAEITDRLKRWRANRNNTEVKDSLERVKGAMSDYDNVEKAGILMPALIDAARAKCTLGEMMEAIVEVSGGRIYST